jgi:hypothetical protein
MPLNAYVTATVRQPVDTEREGIWDGLSYTIS